MQESKGSFVLYNSYKKHLEKLEDYQIGQLLMALFDYVESKQEPTNLYLATLMAFSFISCQMDRDAEKYAKVVEKRRESGKKGGRPKANASEEKAKKANGFSEKQSEAKKPDNDNDNVNEYENDNVYEYVNDNDNVHPYIPPGGSPKSEPVPYKEIVELYHSLCKSYPKLRNVSESRKKAIAARWKEHGQNLDTFRELFTRAEASPFLKGRNDRNWTADFNWLMNSDNMAKVLEGKYNNDNGGGNNGENHQYAASHGSRSDRRETTLSGFRMAD